MRMLSLHLPALLPPHTTQLEVPRTVQNAAAVAVGFLYMGSAKRLVVEVMLKEIDRPPNDEGDTGLNREAYALSCGIALGLVVLGKGLSVTELKDLNIPDQLYFYMTGRRKRFSYLSAQSSVMEGNQTNTDVTAPGAIIALSLMFLKTNNASVAEWFSPPNTLLLLESIKPQHLTLRITAHACVLWDKIRPTKEWVESHIPEVIQMKIKERNFLQTSDEVDMETVVQCHASIICGACFGLGLRFAGSRNKTAYKILHDYVTMFLNLLKEIGTSTESQRPYPTELIGRYVLESCVTTCLISLCMVLAGTGDLKCLQICNYLHVKLGKAEISYGMQMAVHMALGLLFLGKCRKSLCTTNKAIAALLVSLHPCFPGSSTDSQYHLQALRHFYVLATEDRLLVPIDCTTKLPCYAQVKMKFKSTEGSPQYEYSTVAPCILPEIHLLKSIEVEDCRHWPLSIDCMDTEQMSSYINHGLCVQRRAGYYPYIVDPKGYRRNLELSTKFQISQEISSNSPFLQSYIDLFQDAKLTENTEITSVTLLQNLVQNLVKSEQTEQLFILSGLMHMQHYLGTMKQANPMFVWQLRLANEYMTSKFCQNTVAAEFLAIVNRKLQNKLNEFLCDVKEILKTSDKTKLDESVNSSEDILQILSNQNYFSEIKVSHLVAYFLYHKIPLNLIHKSSDINPQSRTHLLKLLTAMKIQISVAVQLSKSLCC